MTNSCNNTPIDHDDRESEHTEHVSPGRLPRTSDTRQSLLDEELQFDVWLEESWAIAEAEEDGGDEM